jgi:hypothetical protein
MAERVFAGKLRRAGFADVWDGGHRPFGIEVMRRTIPADHQDHVATGVLVKARKPA